MSLTTLRAARDPETSHGRPGCPSAAPGHPPRRGRSPPPADGPHPGTARRGVRLAAEPHARRHRLRAAHPAARQARAGRAGTGSRALLLRGVARPPPRRRPGTRAGHPVRARSAASTRSPRSSAAGPRRSRPGTASPSRRAGSRCATATGRTTRNCGATVRLPAGAVPAPATRPDELVPQGGGAPAAGHRCPASASPSASLESLAVRLARPDCTVPAQELRIPLRRIPTRPRSGFVVTGVRAS